MKIRTGHIPTDIIYTFGATKKVCRRWDKALESDENLVFTEVQPVWLAEVDNAKVLETCRKEADQSCWFWDAKAQVRTRVGTVQKIEVPNEPMSGVQLITLDYNKDGVLGYKAITPNGYYVDICNDVLLEALLKVGAGPGGVLGGQFVWGKVDGLMKLIRVDSELYEALLETGERGMMSPLSKNSLVPGTVYESKTGDRAVFLGLVNSEAWELLWPDSQGAYRLSSIQDGKKPKLAVKPVKRYMLWFEVSRWNFVNQKVDPTLSLFNAQMALPALSTSIKLKSSHTMIREVGTIPIPSNIIEHVRQQAINKYQSNYKMAIQAIKAGRNPHAPSYAHTPRTNPYYKDVVVCNGSACCLMHSPDSSMPTVDAAFDRLAGFVGKVVEE